MPKLSIGRPDNDHGLFWPTKPNEKYYINDTKTDLGITVTPGYGITINFLLPGKKTFSYGQLNLYPEQAEVLVEMLNEALKQFEPQQRMSEVCKEHDLREEDQNRPT